MGRWAKSEHDRMVVQKLRCLYDSCDDAFIKDDKLDMRFNTFIRILNPRDKAVQACFESLIRQTYLSSTASRRTIRTLPVSAPGSDNIPTDGPPRRISTRRHYTTHRPPEDVAFPHAPYLSRTASADVPPAASTTFTLPSILLHDATESHSSRAASPSRMRRLGLNPEAEPFQPFRRNRSASPPTAASQRWLDEYAAFAEPYGDEDPEDLWGFGGYGQFLENPEPVWDDLGGSQQTANASANAANQLAGDNEREGPLRRRRRRGEDSEDEEGEGLERSLRRRRVERQRTPLEIANRIIPVYSSSPNVLHPAPLRDWYTSDYLAPIAPRLRSRSPSSRVNHSLPSTRPASRSGDRPLRDNRRDGLIFDAEVDLSIGDGLLDRLLNGADGDFAEASV